MDELIERLRREAAISDRPGQMDRLNALADEFAAASKRQTEAGMAEKLSDRLEALREALEDIRSRSSINLAMHPDPFALTARLGDIYQIADAALAKEEVEQVAPHHTAQGDEK